MSKTRNGAKKAAAKNGRPHKGQSRGRRTRARVMKAESAVARRQKRSKKLSGKPHRNGSAKKKRSARSAVAIRLAPRRHRRVSMKPKYPKLRMLGSHTVRPIVRREESHSGWPSLLDAAAKATTDGKKLVQVYEVDLLDGIDEEAKKRTSTPDLSENRWGNAELTQEGELVIPDTGEVRPAGLRLPKRPSLPKEEASAAAVDSFGLP